MNPRSTERASAWVEVDATKLAPGELATFKHQKKQLVVVVNLVLHKLYLEY